MLHLGVAFGTELIDRELRRTNGVALGIGHNAAFARTVVQAQGVAQLV